MTDVSRDGAPTYMSPLSPSSHETRQAVVFGDLEGVSAASLSNHGWDVTLMRPEGRDLGAIPAGVRSTTFLGDDIPLPEASIDLIVLIDALEYAIDDTALLQETHRILRPGGRAVIRVPLAGRIAWLDARNIHHYLRSTTGRGEPLPEMPDGGFRRHYERREIAALLAEAGLPTHRSRSSALGLSEIAYLGGTTLFRWLKPDPRFQRVRRAYGRLDRTETRWPFGAYYLTVLVYRPNDSTPRTNATLR